MCDQVNQVDPVHQVNKVDEVHQVHQVDPVHQVNEIDEVHQVNQVHEVKKKEDQQVGQKNEKLVRNFRSRCRQGPSKNDRARPVGPDL